MTAVLSLSRSFFLSFSLSFCIVSIVSKQPCLEGVGGWVGAIVLFVGFVLFVPADSFERAALGEQGRRDRGGGGGVLVVGFVYSLFRVGVGVDRSGARWTIKKIIYNQHHHHHEHRSHSLARAKRGGEGWITRGACKQSLCTYC